MMKKKRATLILLCALAMPLPATAAIDDIFSVMFRMMLVMMNVMSDTMLGNNNSSGQGMNNMFGLGAFPAMGTMYGMNPMGGMSGFAGMSPWSGMGSFPGMSPWSGMGGFPGMSPWSGMSGMPVGAGPWPGGVPGNGYGMSPWSTPMMGDSWAGPYAGEPSPYGNTPYNTAARPVTLLEGRWFSNTGEVLEVRGNRFRLQQGQYGTNGAIGIENNLVNLYSQDTGTVTQYTFVRNQSALVLQDASGQITSFSRRPVNNAVHIF